jgi:hypothetical protein
MSKPPAKQGPSREVAAFLAKVKAMPALRAGARGGRLIFALDATASREPLWEQACRLQGDLFLATQGLGALEVQLAWYRGLGEFEASPFVTNSTALVERMRRVTCAAGETQIERVLRHAAAETRARKVDALVFVGDAMEESIDVLAQRAGELGLLGLPCFMFQEGGDPVARAAFERVARLTGGAYCPFDAGSAQALRDLLAAVATFAVGGRVALEDFTRKSGGAVKLLAAQVGKPRGG